ncbi:unnamed protein product [Caenorhabditis auriculariae]|uniref:Uncharacterized protein n=1 Tax=Caenorhabditis auriculariae TaxID=2777116 RepID=A0A8S1GP73_9PELO|nr:unnamed protein product [Caenorhabditis auriculariae]
MPLWACQTPCAAHLAMDHLRPLSSQTSTSEASSSTTTGPAPVVVSTLHPDFASSSDGSSPISNTQKKVSFAAEVDEQQQAQSEKHSAQDSCCSLQ